MTLFLNGQAKKEGICKYSHDHLTIIIKARLP